MSEETFVNTIINREIVNNAKDEIDKDIMYREKAKQFLYQRWSWKRFFMSKKRKEHFITVFANTMKMAENIKNNPPGIKINLKKFTPKKFIDFVLERLPAPKFVSEVNAEKTIYFPKIEVKDD